jgi:single-stranded-DNA-specific exonuclease
VFVLPRAHVLRAERIGRDGATVRAMVEGEGGGARLKVLLFRAGDGPLAAALTGGPAAPLHLAGHLRAETWNGQTTAGFMLSDAATSA